MAMTPEQEKLMLDNFKLVYKIAGKYESQGRMCGYYFEDLVSLGSIGLARAAIHFNPSYGYRFSTYAVSQIQGKILNTFRDEHSPRFSRNVFNLYMEIKRARLLNESVQKIASQLGRTEFEVLEAVSFSTPNLSLDVPVPSPNSSQPGRSDASTYLDIVGSPDNYLWIEIREFVGTLPPKLQRIFLQLVEGMEQKEIAEELHVSRQYVSQSLIGEIRKAWKKYKEEG